MGAALVSLMAFAIVIAASFTVLGDVVSLGASSAESLSSTWKQAETLVDSRARAVSASAISTVFITDVEVVIENTGKTKFAPPDFDKWVVIVRYQDTLGDERVEYSDYSAVTTLGGWNVQQVYLDESTSTVEVYEPGIFNSNEEMVINVRLLRVLGVATTNIITIVTPEGERSSVIFQG